MVSSEVPPETLVDWPAQPKRRHYLLGPGFDYRVSHILKFEAQSCSSLPSLQTLNFGHAAPRYFVRFFCPFALCLLWRGTLSAASAHVFLHIFLHIFLHPYGTESGSLYCARTLNYRHICMCLIATTLLSFSLSHTWLVLR